MKKLSYLEVIKQASQGFPNLTDTEHTTVPAWSGKRCTLTSIYNATLALLVNDQDTELSRQIKLAVDVSDSELVL